MCSPTLNEKPKRLANDLFHQVMEGNAVMWMAAGAVAIIFILVLLGNVLSEPITVRSIVGTCDLTPHEPTGLQEYAFSMETWNNVDADIIFDLRIDRTPQYLSKIAFPMFAYYGSRATDPAFITYWDYELRRQWIVIYPDNPQLSPVDACGVYEVVK